MVLDSTFVDNGLSNGTKGGAIYTGGLATIQNSVFTGNKGRGAALYVNAGSPIGYYYPPTTVLNSTFVNNDAGDYGGVFVITGGNRELENLHITSSTIANNRTTRANGSVFGEAARVTLKSTILANNAGRNCNEFDEWPARMIYVDGGHNLRWPSSDTSCFGIFGAPKLGPLADNGGPTQTVALQPGSAAINAGTCTDISGAPVLADQRGAFRPPAGTCDIGAYEWTGLAAHWPLDEGRGATARDVAGQGKHATLSTPARAWSSDPAPAPLGSSTASYWSQKQDGFTLNAPLVTTQVDNLTLAAWVRWDGGSRGAALAFSS